jgi:hypothetical protein
MTDSPVTHTNRAAGNATNDNTNARSEFLFLGGGSSYAVVDAGGYGPINVPFTGKGSGTIDDAGEANTKSATQQGALTVGTEKLIITESAP